MFRMQHSLKVGISGSYGGWNLGDEAILHGIIAELRRSLAVEITVFTRDAEDTRRRHHVERAVVARSFTRDVLRPELERLDLFIIGGGGILFDGEAELFLHELELAQELGVPTMVYAVSAGPLRAPHVRADVCRALGAADVVTVRDRRARQVLEQCGVRNDILVTADPALLVEAAALPPGTLEREGIIPGRPLVGFSVRERGPAAPELDEDHQVELVANAADYVVDRLDADVLLVPMERQRRDLQQCHAVVARMRSAHHRAHVLRGEYQVGELASLLALLDLAVGTRLHFLILAAVQGVPLVPLSYASKVTGFVEALGVEVPALEELNAGRLIAHLDRAWTEREQRRRDIHQAVPRLQDAARRTNTLAVSLLTGPAGFPRGGAAGALPSLRA